MAKTRIRFNAEPQHMLVIDAKTSVAGGKEVDVDESVAAELMLCNYADITIVDGSTPDPEWPGTHAGVDALAEKIAFAFPQPAPGKSKLTVAEKIDALEDAGHTPASVLEQLDGGSADDNDEGQVK